MKRTNQPHTEVFLVAKGNQALAKTGNISAAGNSVNILDGQLGVIAATSAQAHLDSNDFLNATNNPAGSAANTAANVPAIRIVQGTPSSADTSQLYGWHYEHPAFVKSGIIRTNTVQSFTAQVAAVPTLSAKVFTGLVDANVRNSSEYTAYLEFRSRRNDRDFGANVEMLPIVVETPDFTVVTVDSKLDWLITQTVATINKNSKLYNNPLERGNRDVVAFAINTAGGDGTVIGTLEVGDAVPYFKVGTQTYTVTLTKAMLETLHNLITNSAVTATSTIEVVDLTTSGNGTLATGTLTATANFTANDALTVGSDTYTFVASPSTAGEVLLGANLAASLTNLAAYVNANSTEVTAVATTTTVVFTAVVSGTAGNALALTEDTDAGNVFSVSAATLTGATNTNKDKFVIVGLPQASTVGYSGIASSLTRVDVEFGDTFQIAPVPSTIEASQPFEGYGQGTLLKIRYDRRAFGYTGSLQQTGHADEVILAPSYIDAGSSYTAYIIDYFDTETTITIEQTVQKRIWILVPATDDSASATAASGIAATTNAATTLTDLQAILKPWLESNTGIELLGDATTSTYFA